MRNEDEDEDEDEEDEDEGDEDPESCAMTGVRPVSSGVMNFKNHNP